MPLYDFQCKNNHITESVQKLNVRRIKCRCGSWAKRIVSASGQYCGNEDAAWLKKVIEVVGWHGRETQEFRRHPTRSNLKVWMKAKGLRHMEPGEEKLNAIKYSQTKEYEQYRAQAADRLAAWYQKRVALEVRS